MLGLILGLAVVALGLSAFTQQGLQLTRSARLSGVGGKSIGVLCVLGGALLVIDGVFASLRLPGLFSADRWSTPPPAPVRSRLIVLDEPSVSVSPPELSEDLKAQHEYLSRVTDALNAYQEGNLTHAHELLEACAPELRHWEWHYVSRLASGENCRREITLPGDASPVWCVALSADASRLAAGYYNGRIVAWDVQTDTRASEWWGHQGLILASVSDLTFTPDGRSIASAGEDDFVRFWDFETGQKHFEFWAGESEVDEVAVAENLIATRSSLSGSVQLWSFGGAERLAEIEADKWNVRIAFNPAVTHLATGGSTGDVILWDTSTRERTFNTDCLDASVSCLAFNKDGSQLAVGGRDGSLKVILPAAGSNVLTLAGHSERVSMVTFSPDSARLASLSDEGIIKLWDLRSGRECLSLEEEDAWELSFASNGTQIVAAGGDRRRRDNVRLVIWDCGADEIPSPNE